MTRRVNVRRSNGSRRSSLRSWLRSLGRPCWICREFGRSGEIDYSLPVGHPLCFEVDELMPVSLGGDPLDPSNVDAAHRCCNQWRGNRTVEQVRAIARASRSGKHPRGAMLSGRRDDKPVVTSRDWRSRE